MRLGSGVSRKGWCVSPAQVVGGHKLVLVARDLFVPCALIMKIWLWCGPLGSNQKECCVLAGEAILGDQPPLL